MPSNLPDNILNSIERHKLYLLSCTNNELPEIIASLQSNNISILNLGHEIALFIEQLQEHDYLHIWGIWFYKESGR